MLLSFFSIRCSVGGSARCVKGRITTVTTGSANISWYFNFIIYISSKLFQTDPAKITHFFALYIKVKITGMIPIIADKYHK